MTGPHQKKTTTTTSFEEVDQIDLKIMEVLQKDARITNQALADRVALSPSACLRRVRDLETRGLISAYRAQIQVDRMRSIMVVMAHITFSQHTLKNLHEFDACIESLPEIVESYRVSGNVDYILRVVVPDMHAWKKIMTVLVNGGFGVEKIVSHFLMDQIKTFKGYRLLQKPGDGD